MMRAQEPDTGSFQFTESATYSFEITRFATLTVARSGSASIPVTLSYAMRDDTASATKNYDATPGTVTFASGETSKDLRIWAFNPNGRFANGFPLGFFVTLSCPATPNAVGVRSTAEVFIADNDFMTSDCRLSGTSGSIHGSTAGSSVNGPNHQYEPVHGSPPSTTSVWYQMPDYGSFTLTCATAYVEVYSGSSQLLGTLQCSIRPSPPGDAPCSAADTYAFPARG